MKDLARFAETCTGLDHNSKLKLILFAAEAKPNTYIHLKITKNYHDKHAFEELLRKHNIPFECSRAKGFEEITRVSAKAAHWRLAGTWYGYDLFRNKKAQVVFHQAVALIRQGKHAQADKILGKHYGYPDCCVKKFIATHDPKEVAKKTTAYNYFKELHDSDKAFPFITHTPCSSKCAASKKLNDTYKKAVQAHAPRFFREYAKKRTYHVQIVIDADNDLIPFKKKDAYDYGVVTLDKIEGHYVMISWLSQKKYARGTVLDATVTLQYDYGLITPKKIVRKGTGFRHERHLTKL
ncbi:hypothetical protein C4580_00240 [Candidatus Woesearchaeota archaeon]|nr:MAG: hypothetical protein C4580_00240 [Candidatus Woesearchaeota archaeon]